MTEVLAGWYPDPAGGAVHRWWDGGRWTESTSPIDPGAAPVYGRPAAPSNIGLSPAARITHEFSVAGPDYGPTAYGREQAEREPGPAAREPGPAISEPLGHRRARLVQANRFAAAVLLCLLVLLTVALLVR
ncbi:MAG: DUF2510 domain-containing protein [Jatrophihabitantaceae bacterium]